MGWQVCGLYVVVVDLREDEVEEMVVVVLVVHSRTLLDEYFGWWKVCSSVVASYRFGGGEISSRLLVSIEGFRKRGKRADR